jgi:hypothetical protein
VTRVTAPLPSREGLLTRWRNRGNDKLRAIALLFFHLYDSKRLENPNAWSRRAQRKDTLYCLGLQTNIRYEYQDWAMRK